MRGGRRDALAQHGAAQRADPVNQVETDAARALYRQEIGEQRTVEQVDGQRAALHIGAALRIVARQQVWRTEPDARRVTVQQQDGRFVVIDWKLEDRAATP